MSMSKKQIIFLSIKLLVSLLILVLLGMPFIYPLEADLSLYWEQQLLALFNANNVTIPPEYFYLKIFASLVLVAGLYIVTTIATLLLEIICSRKNRTKTVAGLINSIIKVVVFIAAVAWVLSVLGVNVVAIFASLGVVSLILGFGLQSLIEDCVTGIFIIIEGQFNIGDIVVIGDFRGTVKKINIRTTTIEDAGGNLKIVNNSDIRNIQNRSNNNSVAICDVSIRYEEDLDKVEKIIKAALENIYEKNKSIFKTVPIYAGVQSLGASGVILRILAATEEKDVFAGARVLNREIKLLFDAHKIEIPYNQLEVHSK